MPRLIFLLCTLFFITVKAEVAKNPNVELLKNLETKFVQFKELQKEISALVNTDIHPERKKLWKIVDDSITSLKNDIKTANNSLETAYKDPMSSTCMRPIERWLNSFEILKSNLRVCPNYLISPADFYLHNTSTNAKNTKSILREHLRKSRTCKDETCTELLQEYYSYSNSTFAKLKEDYAKYYLMLDDTDLVKECIKVTIRRARFSANTVKYTDRFKQCLSRKTNIRY